MMNGAKNEGAEAEASAGMGAQCRGFCLVATDPLKVAELRLRSN